jgi:hypothetical protein
VTPVECAREPQTLRLVLARRWPDGADAELRAHVASCQVCSDVAAVAALLGPEREASLRRVHVPAAGQVWWRAALRAHAEAAEAARRPILWLQGIAGACAVAIFAAAITLVWPELAAAAGRLASLRPDVAPLVETLRPVAPLGIAILACLVLTPIVLYFALSDE